MGFKDTDIDETRVGIVGSLYTVDFFLKDAHPKVYETMWIRASVADNYADSLHLRGGLFIYLVNDDCPPGRPFLPQKAEQMMQQQNIEKVKQQLGLLNGFSLATRDMPLMTPEQFSSPDYRIEVEPTRMLPKVAANLKQMYLSSASALHFDTFQSVVAGKTV